MDKDIKRILLSSEQISKICVRLGKQISEDYENKEVLFVGLLKGCQPFLADLLKHVSLYCQVHYMMVSSYHGTTSSSGSLLIKQDLDIDVKDKHIVIVDDIVDTGVTLDQIKTLLLQRGASSIEIAALLDKVEGRVVDVDVKYIGTPIEKEFVVGYGLDYNELYRNLPYIGILKEEVYTKE